MQHYSVFISDKVDIEWTKNSVVNYADDLVLISRSSDDLQKGLDALKQFCETRQLMVNTNKSKIMLVTKKCVINNQQ